MMNIDLTNGYPKNPWIVYKSDEAGIWPLGTFTTKEKALFCALNLTADEDTRFQQFNEMLKEEGRQPYSRDTFDDYFIKRFDEGLPITKKEQEK